MSKLSVIIACYNEEQTIEQVVETVERAPCEKQIIVVDDGSTDGSLAKLRPLAESGRITLIAKPKNEGKGAAIRSALDHLEGDIVIIQDADLEYDPAAYPDVIGPIERGEADVVYGSRFLGSITGMRWQNRLANLILIWLARLLYLRRITDEATCYKAFRADVLRSLKLKCMRFEFCPEVTAKVFKRGLRFREVPIVYRGRSAASGKKIGWRDGIEAIWTLVKYRFRD